MELLRNIFIGNGYLRKLVEKIINDLWKVELENQIYNDQQKNDLDIPVKEEKSEYFNTLYAPYIAGFSEKLAKDLKHINVGSTFLKGLLSLTPFQNLNHVPRIFLGKTQQWFPSRRNQHQYAVKNKTKPLELLNKWHNKATSVLEKRNFIWF